MSIQVKSSKQIKLLEKPTSKSENQETNTLKNIIITAKIEEPGRPKNLPKRLINIKESKGKNNPSKYIA